MTEHIVSLLFLPPSIILATNIAESSITLARVHSVIDLGQERYVSLHPVTGLAELKTRRISQASAKQRTGRAGRLGPGHSLRLWSRDQQAELIAHQPAELSYAELTETYLQCAFWGADRADLDWLEQPPTGRWRAAHNRLVAWGAIDPNGQIRAHGKLMVNVGLEPWLGHFLITAQSFDCLSAAIYLAAHLSSQEALQYDPFSQRSARSFKPAVIAEAQKLAQRFNQPHVLQFEPITEPALIQALADRLVYQLQSERAILISGTEVRSKAHFKVGQWWLLLDGIRSGREILASAWLAVSTEAAPSSSSSSLYNQDRHYHHHHLHHRHHRHHRLQHHHHHHHHQNHHHHHRHHHHRHYHNHHHHHHHHHHHRQS